MTSTTDVPRLYCVPHAGGTAGAFRRWAAAFGTDVAEVVPLELPGRGRRAREPFAETVQDAAAVLAGEIAGDLDRPGGYVLLGHCMGALVAFEMARRLEADGARPAELLLVSGRNPPHLQTEWGLRVAPLPDDELFAELQAVGGVPPGLSRAMAGDFLPMIRADQRMVHRYDAGWTDRRVTPPVLVLGGRDDTMTDGALLGGWSAYTRGGCTVATLAGGHYFLYEHAAAVRELLVRLRGVPA
ncbi:thioesterase II family protein [Pseudonocardia sp. HH130630-07]|uniref:thioesterase II family protein n=1 Tax=Pseudonocardia sp. HH130630-07 TaxID=1690815 RepID=UPI000814EBFF|nr:alpha/beta fold hydrolase [Pseudonocardia sp. HH130630-07]ANY07824.1 hypothetical protein AFB00_17685 [Pseudonocardia sp. HH130630-07]